MTVRLPVDSLRIGGAGGVERGVAGVVVVGRKGVLICRGGGVSAGCQRVLHFWMKQMGGVWGLLVDRRHALMRVRIVDSVGGGRVDGGGAGVKVDKDRIVEGFEGRQVGVAFKLLMESGWVEGALVRKVALGVEGVVGKVPVTASALVLAHELAAELIVDQRIQLLLVGELCGRVLRCG